MFTFDVAHVRVRGTDLILVPVGRGFAGRPAARQRTVAAALQGYAARAGLAGTVVPVWPGDRGRLTFFARPGLHSRLGTLTWADVTANLNVRLTVRRLPAAVPTRMPVAVPA